MSFVGGFPIQLRPLWFMAIFLFSYDNRDSDDLGNEDYHDHTDIINGQFIDRDDHDESDLWCIVTFLCDIAVEDCEDLEDHKDHEDHNDD